MPGRRIANPLGSECDGSMGGITYVLLMPAQAGDSPRRSRIRHEIDSVSDVNGHG